MLSGSWEPVQLRDLLFGCKSGLTPHSGLTPRSREFTTDLHNCKLQLCGNNCTQLCPALTPWPSARSTQAPPSSTQGDSSPDFFLLRSAQSRSEEETEAPHFDTPLRPQGKQLPALLAAQRCSVRSQQRYNPVFSATPLLLSERASLHLLRRAL